MFVIVEMADVELVGLHVYTDEKTARIALASRNHCSPAFSSEDLKREIPGTLAAAGDDSCSVQLVHTVAV